jgi:4-hydroxy-tetrahydrodipicolinate synthase
VTCNGHAGEVASLTRDERRRALGIAVEAVAGRVPVITGIYAENWRQAVELARDARRENAGALLMFPLNALVFDGTPEMVIRHFHEVASAVDLPMVVFVYPEWTRMRYDADTLARLLAVPNVIAVKEWSLDIRIYERNLSLVREADRGISMLSSFSTILLPSLVLGADGILSGHGSVIADIQPELLEAVWASNLERAREVSGRIQKLTRAVYRSPMANVYTRR